MIVRGSRMGVWEKDAKHTLNWTNIYRHNQEKEMVEKLHI